MVGHGNSLDRRDVLKGMGVGGLALIAGCSGDGSSGGGNGELQTGGHLRTTTRDGPSNLNPLEHVRGVEYQLTYFLYSNLTRLDNELNVHPDLATDWETNDDYTQYTFELRDDATFNYDGSQVTATDVKATMDRHLTGETEGSGRINMVDTVEAVDETTVQFNLSSPYVDLPHILGIPFMRILPEDALENRYEEISSTDFGSGPFNLEEFVVDDHVRMVANEDYYRTDDDGEQIPYVDELTQNVYPNANTEGSALESQESDIVWRVEPTQWDRFESMTDVNVLQGPSLTWFGAAMRATEPPFDDNRVRRACKLALDKQEMLEVVNNGMGTVAQTPVGPAHRFYADLDPWERDLDQARSLLEEAGYEDGFEITCHAADEPQARIDLAVLLQDQLGEIGIDVEVNQMSYDRFLSEIWGQGKFYTAQYWGRPTEDGILRLILHQEGSWHSDTGWVNEEFEDSIDQARATVDESEREQLYQRAQEIVHEEGPYLMFFFRDELRAANDYVQNYDRPNPLTNELRINEAWLSSDSPTQQ